VEDGNHPNIAEVERNEVAGGVTQQIHSKPEMERLPIEEKMDRRYLL
jgi:hypothetical protein